MHRLLLLFTFVVATSASAQAVSGQRPNVVLIITDDVGYGD
ncbi:MAG: hypothetical protein JWL61_1454, partial [Gemmatimonadetes bacterium]|nr:hypothetical protein [Gemmatimonadota bacterium]